MDGEKIFNGTQRKNINIGKKNRSNFEKQNNKYSIKRATFLLNHMPFI